MRSIASTLRCVPPSCQCSRAAAFVCSPWESSAIAVSLLHMPGRGGLEARLLGGLHSLRRSALGLGALGVAPGRHALAGLDHRVDDLGVAGAAAQVARERLADLARLHRAPR